MVNSDAQYLVQRRDFENRDNLPLAGKVRPQVIVLVVKINLIITGPA
jgi:hypothetical protein